MFLRGKRHAATPQFATPSKQDRSIIGPRIMSSDRDPQLPPREPDPDDAYPQPPEPTPDEPSPDVYPGIDPTPAEPRPM